jgi:predicted NodU family carbamoyl transferase
MTSRNSTTSSVVRHANLNHRADQREMDIAASIQKVTEEVMLRMVRHVHETRE